MTAPVSAEYISLIDIAVALLRQRGLILKASLSAALAATAIIFLLGREYASEARFVPDSGTANIGAISGLAAQFGLAGALGGGAQSPDFYASLAKSRTVLGAVADTIFHFERIRGALFWRDTVAMTGTVAELYRIDRPNNRARERDEAIELLADIVSAGASLETGVITVRVQTDWPELSYQVAQLILERIAKYNLVTLQSRASEERRFIEERLSSQRIELATEEDSLRVFLEKNRSFAAAPQLLLEHDRLQRKVALRQQVVVGLAQSYEQSRIEEVRNTPVVTMVQVPEVPAKSVKRYLPLKVLLAAGLAFALFSALAIVQESAKDRARGVQPDPDELGVLWKATINDLLGMLRLQRKA